MSRLNALCLPIYSNLVVLLQDPDQCSHVSLQAAWQMHNRICNTLLSAYESLQTTFEYYLNDICGSHFKLGKFSIATAFCCFCLCS